MDVSGLQRVSVCRTILAESPPQLNSVVMSPKNSESGLQERAPKENTVSSPKSVELPHMTTYAAFAKRHPDARRLISNVINELGRHGQCGTLNPTIGYVLRQKGLKSVVVTAEITCPDAPIVKQMDTGYHLWLLAADDNAVWHVDAANFFLINQWYKDKLRPDQWDRVARGKEPGPPVPLDPANFIWGQPSSHGITITPGSLSAQLPFFDTLDEVGKRHAVRELFRSHGFHDPYEFPGGVLDIAEVDPPL